ncbi:MAG TPA: fumarylacetoacetate hydrolase family protein [Polyangiaceae bacterium]|nr:fumarylacetoacetate hydrolase family protein [Polyangiaceae bacterium]
MRLASLDDGTRDGSLAIIDASGRSFTHAEGIASSLQRALDDWSRVEPALRDRADQLDRGSIRGESLAGVKLTAPLPRAYEWIDGSAYLNHVRLVRRARGAAPPDDLESNPLVYQGGSGVLLGPADPLAWVADAGLDFEGEIAVVVSDVPRATPARRASEYFRLVMIANDVTYREMVPAELKKGFGFFVSKPSTAFSPFAITLDELGGAFRDGRAFLRLACTYNGSRVGDLLTGEEMHFSFCDLVAHATRTRALAAGTIIGSGTVSNEDATHGVACLAERRTRETLSFGAPRTPYMKPGDVIRIEAFDSNGRSVCGAIEQRVTSEQGAPAIAGREG